MNKNGKLVDVGKHQRRQTNIEIELARVKRELAEHGVEVGVCRIKRTQKSWVGMQAEEEI